MNPQNSTMPPTERCVNHMERISDALDLLESSAESFEQYVNIELLDEERDGECSAEACQPICFQRLWNSIPSKLTRISDSVYYSTSKIRNVITGQEVLVEMKGGKEAKMPDGLKPDEVEAALRGLCRTICEIENFVDNEILGLKTNAQDPSQEVSRPFAELWIDLPGNLFTARDRLNDAVGKIKNVVNPPNCGSSKDKCH